MSDVEQSVLYMKVTEALREPEPDRLEDLSKTYNIADFPNLLYLAVELSSLDTVKWVAKLYETKNRDVNEKDLKTGNTALHEAVANGREQIVRHLMELPIVDDTIRNNKGLTALELASTPEMEHVISASENKFAEKLAVRLKRAFKTRDTHELQLIYSNPRVNELMNINGIDPETGRTVLHDAAAENDLKLVQFILAHGGDPLLKDKRLHKIPQEMTTNEEIRKLLLTAAKSKAILDQTNLSPSAAASSGPTMTGYLKKWTNITTGYKLRWFVLQNGWLSYYKQPEDAKKGEKLIRGTIGLRHAIVKLDSSEKNKFEVRTPSVKFHLKATHQAECNKWVWALQNAITAARDESKKATKGIKAYKETPDGPVSATPSVAGLNISGERGSVSSVSSPVPNSNHIPHIPGSPNSPTSPGSPNGPHNGLSSSSTQLQNKMQRRQPSVSSIAARSTSSQQNELFVNDLSQKGEYESDNYEDEELDKLVLKGPKITSDSLIDRLGAIKNLLQAIAEKIEDEKLADAIATAENSIDILSSDTVMFERQASASKRIVESEVEDGDRAQRTWATNYRDLELQCETLEGQLHEFRKMYNLKQEEDEDDEFFDTVEAHGSDDEFSEPEFKVDPAKDTKSFVTAPESKSSKDKFSAKDTIEETAELNEDEAAADADSKDVSSSQDATKASSSDASADTQQSSAETTDKANNAGAATGAAAGNDGESDDENAHKEDEDEDSKEIESLVSKSDGVPPDPTGIQKKVLETIMEDHSFNGYEDPPRERLKIDADNRPKLSLWSILKNLIGKDMTKMTLPVTFNECTSLLQRSAEDMEYVNLLDRAAETIDDPGLRMAYIAAFAGSSYSSTINRVAKPFNPLLGETYEYCRPDQGFRMFAEQVSHHPPIGALIAESPRWDFYGESNVESKFYGRSFDINPLGLWYICLRPDKGCENEEELYSFRKLTSSVIGIMMGRPVVDNYGEMHIENYTTGVHAVINYKARGWRGSSAYKLQGKIYDKDKNELWTMGGTWNDKMWAKKTGSDKAVLLWKAHPRHKTPFNLTDFAITLNALPERLKEWLPPTDTRLRPDQRAMEEGRYDDASDDKNRVEQKQRARRREREEAGIEYKPRWFEKVNHPVTGKEYYKPINNYWKLRSEKKLSDVGDIF
mgnify:FL=1